MRWFRFFRGREPEFLRLKVMPKHGHIYNLNLEDDYKILITDKYGYYIKAGEFPCFILKENADVRPKWRQDCKDQS